MRIVIAHQRLLLGSKEERRFPESNSHKLQKDPRTKNPRVFCYVKVKMNIEQNKHDRVRNDWIREHVLSSEQRKELIMNKVLRAQEQLKRLRRIESKELVK